MLRINFESENYEPSAWVVKSIFITFFFSSSRGCKSFSSSSKWEEDPYNQH